MSSLTGTCHCGAVRVTVPRKPRSVTDCNCSICRRYGVLWAYDHEGEGIHVAGPAVAYARGTALTFNFCPTCGCVAFWRGLRLDEEGRRRIAVNLQTSVGFGDALSVTSR